jgi:hypothetical protein
MPIDLAGLIEQRGADKFQLSDRHPMRNWCACCDKSSQQDMLPLRELVRAGV